ncbi:SCO6745 family protein [Saccharopolyspora taberi]|uniref:SalK n=1 Tax=Saccharopolyspora taberi TaxID=60895 RepID=A0ABN3VI98_9PSEU
MTTIARRGKSSLDLLHSMIYFAPEAADEFAALGLDRGLMSYLAGRSAPMGAVGAGVVSATFYNFNPAKVAAEIPRAWSIAAPSDVIAARFRAVDGALRRLLGAEVTSDLVATTAELAQAATQDLRPDGKPLYAAHADLAWPEEPHLRLWHAVSLLREFRGDAHITALQRAGLSGLQALVLHVATGEGFTAEAARRTRVWSEDEWAAGVSELRQRGLVDADGAITEQGAALREEVETETDAMSAGPWESLSGDQLDVLLGNGSQLSRALLAAGALPPGLFAKR